MRETLEVQIKTSSRKKWLLRGKYPDLDIGSMNPDALYLVPHYDGRPVTAHEYTSITPGWDNVSACFWWDKSTSAWDGLETAADVLRQNTGL